MVAVAGTLIAFEDSVVKRVAEIGAHGCRVAQLKWQIEIPGDGLKRFACYLSGDEVRPNFGYRAGGHLFQMAADVRVKAALRVPVLKNLRRQQLR